MTMTKEVKRNVEDLFCRSDYETLAALRRYIKDIDRQEYEKLLLDAQYDLDLRAEEYIEYREHLFEFFSRYGFTFKHAW